MPSLEYRELLSQSEVFQQETTTGTKEPRGRAEIDRCDDEHDTGIAEIDQLAQPLSY
jgi:hypothetical protein